MKIVVYITNHLPQPKLGFISPFEMIWNHKPIVSHQKALAVFAMYLCLITYVASSIKRHDDVSSWIMIMQEKVGDAMIPLLVDATS